MNLRQFCADTLRELEVGRMIGQYGLIYCDRCMDLYRYKLGLKQKIGLFSTAHHNIFENILLCLDGAQWEEKGEYGNNFRAFIKAHLVLDKD